MSEKSDSNREHLIEPRPLEIGVSATELIERTMLRSGAGLIADSARHFTDLVLASPGAYIGLSVDALITPGGLGISAILPLLKGGYIDWLSMSGPNLYYDTLTALCKPLYRVPPENSATETVCDDCGGNIYLRREDRIHAEATLKEIFSGPDFQQMSGSADLYHLLGRELRALEKNIGVRFPCLISTAYELGIPVFNPAPAGGPLGSFVASLAFMGNRLLIDPNQDLNESAALLNDMARKGTTALMWSFGNGESAAFAGQIPAHLERILGQRPLPNYAMHIVLEAGSDLSQPLPGRLADSPVDPTPVKRLDTPAEEPLHIHLRTDLGTAIPLLAAYILDRIPTRPLKRLCGNRDNLIDRLRQNCLEQTLKDFQPPRQKK
jgi:deoxyhypusine synthase